MPSNLVVVLLLYTILMRRAVPATRRMHWKWKYKSHWDFVQSVKCMYNSNWLTKNTNYNKFFKKNVFELQIFKKQYHIHYNLNSTLLIKSLITKYITAWFYLILKHIWYGKGRPGFWSGCCSIKTWFYGFNTISSSITASQRQPKPVFIFLEKVQ